MPPVEQIHVTDLIDSSLPDRLPTNTQLKVWVRSTGFEVRFTQKKSLSNALYWILALVFSALLAAYLLLTLGTYAPYHYLAVLLPASVGTLILVKLARSSRSNIRLDITPMTIAINYLGNRNRPESQEHVPLKEIESFYIDDARGLGLNSTISEILYRTWIGSGLQKPDLYYLASLIVESSKLSMQRPHPGSQ